MYSTTADDELFAKVIACIRIAVRNRHDHLHREQVRERAPGLGISQISGASHQSAAVRRGRPHDSTV
ncbi:MAG: hypothetical protein ACLSGI_11125 [Butyricicoccaceae bacterium]